ESLASRAAGFGCFVQLHHRVDAITVQVQGPAGDQDPAVSHAVDVFARDIVGQGDRRIARVRLALVTDLQLPAQQYPLGGELEIRVVGKAELAVDIHAMQRRRTDIEDDVQTRADSDYVTLLGNGPAGPGGWIGP